MCGKVAIMVFIEVLVVTFFPQGRADAACGQLPGHSKETMAFGVVSKTFRDSDAGGPSR